MLESKMLTLTTISPLHIKGHEVTYGWGMVKLDPRLYPDNDYAYIVDQEKLNRFLAENGLIGKYVRVFSNPQSFDMREIERERRRKGLPPSPTGSPLGDFLTDNKIKLNKNNLEKISSGITLSKGDRFFICDSKDNVIIPGSSVKGALRTAVAYKYVKDNSTRDPNWFPQHKQDVERKIQQFHEFHRIGDRKREDELKKKFAEELMQKAFGDEPQSDLFRSLKISDALPDKKPEQEKIKVVCVDSANQAYFGKAPPKKVRDIESSCECLPEGTRASFRITLDTKILEQWKKEHRTPPFKNIDDLMQIAQEFATAQWKFENEFLGKVSSGVNIGPLKEFYRTSKGASLRLGWGTGLLGTTIDLLFADADPALLRAIRGIVARPPRPQDPDPAPKSRRIVMRNNTPSFPLGWVELTSSES